MYKRQIREPTKEVLTFLDESINIQAPDPWATTYREMLYRYHDVISKGKFNLGWTDVVEHKIELSDDDPVHIRQFRIPLEHRQTIYDWVDELLKKGAIEVSRSTYNSPIFCLNLILISDTRRARRTRSRTLSPGTPSQLSTTIQGL